MTRRILYGVILLAIFGAKVAYRSYDHRQQEYLGMMAKNHPALFKMTAENITNSDWNYAGPLGSRTLHFNPDGTLTATADGKAETGRWEISDYLLTAQIPGSDSNHVATFHTSGDQMQGLSQSGSWTANRIK